MTERYFWRGLSSKLLALTIIFVMIAEMLLFIPSAALFRMDWIESRVKSAQQLTLATEGIENFQSSKLLNTQFMDDTDVEAVIQRRAGMTEAVLGVPPMDGEYTTVDMRVAKALPDFGAMFRAYFGDGQGYLRVIAAPAVPDAESLELIIPNAAVKQALIEFCHRILALSALIAVFTGLLIYLALSWLIVRPLQNLAGALGQFREDPEHLAGNITTSTRRDEIGQLEREFVNMKSGIRGALQQKTRLATLGLAVAKINHDLRNVLTSAQLISDRLAGDPEERIRTMGARLVRAVDRGVQLCTATLSYSKSDVDAPKPETVPLAALLNEAALDAGVDAGADKIKWVNDVPFAMNVTADPDHAYRIFNNLFRNAVAALDGRAGAQLRVTAEAGEAHAEISVIDNGPGLPMDARDSLFKPFTSRAKGGTGLGLTISRELARAHGGDLTLERTDESGTVFEVILPV